MARKGIIKSAAILTVSGIINRVLGFVYRIYMSNIIGAEGMGLYQLIMPVYSLAWSISCSGFTTTVSKLTASELAKGSRGNTGRILAQSLAITTGLGLLLGGLLFFGAEFVCQNFIADTRLTPAMKILALSFPFMAAGSCVRGYFFGMQETFVPALSQVIEQLARMGVIYALATPVITKGLEYACAVAVAGIFAGEFISFIMIMASYKLGINRKSRQRPVLSRKASLVMIMAMAVPLTLNRVSGSLLATVENMLLPQRLQLFGLTKSEAIQEFGKISGMAMPLIYFPSAILVSLAISLVPAISEALAVENYRRINYTVTKVMLFSCIIGVGASGFFIVFADSLSTAIYKEDIGRLLICLGAMCPFLYMNTTLNGILNGLGEQVFIFRNSLLSSVVSIAFIWLVVPRYGMNGYILGSFVSLLLLCALSLDRIKSISGIKLDLLNWLFKPILSVTAAGLWVNLTKKYLYSTLGETSGLITGTLMMGAVYFLFIILLGTVSLRDFKMLFGRH